MQENGQVFKRNGRGSGLSLPESFASYDRDTSSWRTSGLSLFGGWMQFSESFPRAGMMRSGNVYQLPPLVPRISGTGSGSWPTPDTGGFRSEGSVSMLAKMDVTEEEFRGMAYRAPKKAKDRLWPTPTARDWRSDKSQKSDSEQYGKKGKPLPRAVGGQLNPTWVEWLMGYPSGWTALKDSGTL